MVGPLRRVPPERGRARDDALEGPTLIALLVILREIEAEQRRREESLVASVERAARRWEAAFAEIAELMLRARS